MKRIKNKKIKKLFQPKFYTTTFFNQNGWQILLLLTCYISTNPLLSCQYQPKKERRKNHEEGYLKQE